VTAADYPPGFEVRLLFAGCAINAILLGGVGFLLDRRKHGVKGRARP
jgi:hypothetical protein